MIHRQRKQGQVFSYHTATWSSIGKRQACFHEIKHPVIEVVHKAVFKELKIKADMFRI